MRKTTTKLLAGSLVLVAFAAPPCVWAGSQDGVLSLLLGAASLGEDGKSPAKLADDLLREARQAMQAGDYDAANARIAQAEALHPKYSPFHVGDSPKKARAALEKLRAKKPLPSQRATPYEPAKKAGKDAPHDPFLARAAESAPANLDRNPPSLPMTGPAYPSNPASVERPTSSPAGYADAAMVGSRYAQSKSAPASPTVTDPLPAPAAGYGSMKKALVADAGPTLISPEMFEQPAPPTAPSLLPPSASLADATPVSKVEKQRAFELTKQARAALQRGDAATAEQFARQAMPLVPDTAYTAQDDRPALVLLEVQKIKMKRGGNSMATAKDTPTLHRYPSVPAVYTPESDPSRNTQAVGGLGLLGVGAGVRHAQNTEPSSEPVSDFPLPMDPTVPTPEGGTGEGLKWYRQGVEALAEGQADQALQAFRRAYAFQAELDPVTRQRLQDHMQVLGAPVDQAPTPAAVPLPATGAVPLPAAGVDPTVGGTTRQTFAEVARQQGRARDMREKQPKQALELLQQTKDMVASAGDIDQAAREQLIRRLDMSMDELRQYITQNAPQIELDERNRLVEAGNDRARQQKVEVDEEIAYMVNDFNKLCDEGRFAEAQVLAKRAAALAPDNPLAVQLYWTSRFLERDYRNNQVRDAKEDGFWRVLQEVDEAAVPFPGDYVMPDANEWDKFRKSQYRQKQEGQFRKTPKDMEIEHRLSTPVSLKFHEQPLAEVISYLGTIAQVPVFLDPQGLAAEGVTSETPITIDLTQDISLKSALKLILEPLRLTYIIKDEVLKITTEDQRRGQLFEVVYPVGDLVIPIPNFAPNGREGINAAFREAYERMGWAGATGGSFGWSSSPYFAANQTGKGSVDPQVLAQVAPGGVVPIGGGGPPQTGTPQSIPFGPGGLSGGSQADFDPLIELITGTIATQTWSDLGGPGTIDGFETTLSLVVSQTQEVHEEIADLLTQLRRLQDLQVTIEVRFITLRDEFFERIGVDFDFNLGTHTNPLPATTDVGPPPSFGGNVSPSEVVGLNPLGTPTPNRDIQFRQDSFGTALPQFGGFNPISSGAATFGFAILSDIEAYFLINAAQGDTRSNILQAPKVTLFNGQQATVSDQTQRPFVISVTPVVGDFAAAQQPVIVVLSEGTSLTVQAVVSENRRFVRLTIVPFFSQIGDVEEFTFEGSKTTKKSSSEDKKGDDEESKSEDEEEIVSGTTVQLPEFSFVSVTTTVSVPDGGTVLLGGIKRLAEGRTERGVPILSKMPYINRLFRNVGIGRTTSSLMMMVTPRIIIQEEEEENLLGTAPAP